MKPNKPFLIVTLTVVFCAPAVMAQEQQQPPVSKAEKLGKVHFSTSCSPAAQTQFDRAVALLHSFWFRESVKAFAASTQTDPGCAMGYWGIAMSLLGNPLAAPPSPKALKDGWAAVEKANSAGAKTQRERDFIAAIEVLYKDADKVDHRTRTLAYEQAMERVYLRYPEDREAAVFYALALNMTALPTDKTYANPLNAAGFSRRSLRNSQTILAWRITSSTVTTTRHLRVAGSPPRAAMGRSLPQRLTRFTCPLTSSPGGGSGRSR